MASWLRRTLSGAVARLNAKVDQDADPAALIPGSRRSRRGAHRTTEPETRPTVPGPTVGGPAVDSSAVDGSVGTEPPTEGGTAARRERRKLGRAAESDLTESEARDELARIMAAQRSRMRGGRRTGPPT